MPDSAFVGDDAAVGRRISKPAVALVAVLAAVALFAGGRLLVHSLTSEPGAVSEAALETLPPSSAAPADEPQEATNYVDDLFLEQLALGVAPGTRVVHGALRVAYGAYGGQLSVVDLFDGSVLTIDDMQPLALTADYLLARPFPSFADGRFGATGYSIVDLESMTAVSIETDEEIVAAYGADETNHAWLVGQVDDGFRYWLADFADGGAEIVSFEFRTWVSLVVPPGRSAYLNVPSNGVYEVDGDELLFKGTGSIASASAHASVWTSCDAAYECTTELVQRDRLGGRVLDVGEIAVGKLSPDNRYFAYTDGDGRGLTVLDLTSGVTSAYDIGYVWESERLVFLDRRLLVVSDSGLYLIDLTTGESTRIEQVAAGDFFVVGPTPDE